MEIVGGHETFTPSSMVKTTLLRFCVEALEATAVNSSSNTKYNAESSIHALAMASACVLNVFLIKRIEHPAQIG